MQSLWHRAAPEFARFEGRGVALSVPEVPLEARLALLERGARHGFLRVASFTSAEMPEVVEKRIGRQVDLLTANLDEAAAAVGLAPESAEPAMVVQAAVDLLAADGARLTITAGARGSWSWDGRGAGASAGFPSPVLGTAGAGDAHLAGMIAGLAAGRSSCRRTSWQPWRRPSRLPRRTPSIPS